jgi:hypothetical protein
MTGLQSLEARAALGTSFAVAGLFLSAGSWIQRGSQKLFDRAAITALIVSRLGLYLTVFFILHLSVRGDVPTFYMLPAIAALHHMLPYVDYPTSYAPLHATLDAGLLLLWNSPLVIVLFSIVVEWFLLPVWLRVSRLFVTEAAARIAAVLYLTSALSVQFVTIDGQDNVVLAVLLGLALLALAKQRAALSGALIAVGAAVIKFLPLFFAPAFFLVSVRRIRWFAGFAVVLLLGYGYFILRHVPVLYPLTFEHTSRTASDLPFVLDALFNLAPHSLIEDSILGLALLSILVLLARIGRRRPDTVATLRAITFGCNALILALITFSRKSWPPYLVLTLFPCCLLMGSGPRQRLRLVCFALFNVIAVTSHSFWATVFGQALAPDIYRSLLAHNPAAYTLLILQVALIAGYVWLLAESLSALREPQRL